MGKIINFFRNFNRHLVETCNLWYKKWSSWLAGVFAAAITFLWNEPSVFNEITSAMPAELRAKVSPVIFVILAGVPILIAHLKQNNLKKK